MLINALLVNNQDMPNQAFERALRSIDVSYDVIQLSALGADVDTSSYDCVLLSGTQVSPHEHLDLYRFEIALIRSAGCPILGVCGGHLLLALAFGGVVEKAPQPIYGRTDVRILEQKPLFAGLPLTFTGFAKHQFQIGRVPDVFRVLARSSQHDLVYAMKHRERPFYGVQFHPEQRVDTHVVLQNFVTLTRVFRERGVLEG